MKKLILFWTTLSAFIPITMQGQSPANDPAWITTPKFSDDFNSINSTTWTEYNGYWGDFKTDEDFGFYPERANINTTILSGNSVLELSALNDYAHTATNNHTTPPSTYNVPISSGMIVANSFSTYGYYEASINFATTGDSYMPAFWLYDASNCTCHGEPGDFCSGFYDEIDIEIFGHATGPFEYTSNIWQGRPSYSCPWMSDQTSYIPSSGNLQNSFHKYGIEWMPGHVVIYYDDVPIRIKEDAYTPSHDMRVWFDIGFRSGGHTTNNTFPGYMYVDYLKVYDIKMTDCASTDATFSSAFNSGTYDYKVKRNITFNNGNSTNLTSGIITLRASAGVEVNGDFTVNGADFTILPTGCY